MYVPFICPHPQNCLQQKSKRSEMQKMKLLSCSKQHTDLKEVSDTLVIPCLCWCVLPYYINFFSSWSFYNSNKITVYHKLNSHEKKFFETMCHLSIPFHKIVGRNNKTDRSQIYQNFLCNNQLIIKSRWKPPALDPTYIYMYACILIYTYKPLISEFKFIFHDKMKASMSTRINTSCLM